MKTGAEKDVDSVVYNEFFLEQRAGVMLEVGAAGPDFLSIGASFRNKGWRVISIEPNPGFAAQHRGLGHEIYEYACADRDQDDVDFVVAEGDDEMQYLGGKVTAESFSSLGIRDKYDGMLSQYRERFTLRTIKVKVRRLDTILRDLALTKLDVMAVDVEGWELECLQGFSFGVLAPRVAIIENLFREPAYVDFMKSRGYELWRVLEPNDVYVLAGP